jgi:hypothetical protein
MRAAVGLQQPADNSTATETGDNSTASAGGAGGTANTATVTGDNMTASAGVGNAATATNNGTITRSEPTLRVHTVVSFCGRRASPRVVILVGH